MSHLKAFLVLFPACQCHLGHFMWPFYVACGSLLIALKFKGAHPKQREREPGGSCIAFYDVTLEVLLLGSSQRINTFKSKSLPHYPRTPRIMATSEVRNMGKKLYEGKTKEAYELLHSPRKVLLQSRDQIPAGIQPERITWKERPLSHIKSPVIFYSCERKRV